MTHIDAAPAADTELTGAEDPTPEHVIDIALPMFADAGFEATKLEAVAKASGMSKRMIHYHFGDKRGLYHSALVQALACIAPEQELLDRSYEVPVEGMRRFVDALFTSFRAHPECVRLILLENLNPVLDMEEASTGNRNNDVTLHVERLLMLGQDAGAFRPGVCAEDVLALIVSLCEFQITHAVSSYAVNRVDVNNPRNVDGLRRLVIDAVLTFLTSSIPHSGYDSYLVSDPESEKPPTPSEKLYELDGAGGIY